MTLSGFFISSIYCHSATYNVQIPVFSSQAMLYHDNHSFLA